MLLQCEKFHLNKFLIKYKSFQYLRPDPYIYECQISSGEIFTQNTKGLRKRKIYYKVNYNDDERKAIGQVRFYLSKMQIYENFPNQYILKHLYAADMNIKRTLARLKEVQSYHNDLIITTFTHETQKKLSQGCIYTYGKDKKQNPIIIIKANQFDLQKSLQENFNATYFLMLVVLGYRMVPYHAEKYTLILDMININAKSFAIPYLYSILQKMNIIYSENTEKIFIYNSNSTLNFIWLIVSPFISQDTKNKIFFIEKDNQEEILNYVEEQQLQKKYGGKLQDLKSGQYWPPVPTNDFDKIDFLSLSFKTDYDSILNNSFGINDEHIQICECVNCEIF